MSADKKVLITGASGFIGSRLSRHLRGRGYSVVEYVGDILDSAALESRISGIDVVVHLAAKCDKVRAGREHDDYITVNVLGTKNVADACIKHGCKLIHFSSISANGRSDLYGLSKSYSEELVRLYAKNRELSAVIVRPCGIYDERNRDRLGKPMDFSKGQHYPIGYLVNDVEDIIRTHDFSRGCRTYTPKSFFDYYILYWLKRVRNRITRTR